MTDELDPRARAAEYRRAAGRLRRQADQLEVAMRRPDRHPWRPGPPWPRLRDLDMTAFYARNGDLGRRHAEMLHRLADHLDRAAARLTRPKDPR